MASLLDLGREYAPDQIPLPSLATIGQRDHLIPPPYDPKNYSRGAWKGLKDIGNAMIVEPGWELGGALQNIAEGQGIFGDYANAGMGVAGAVPAGAGGAAMKGILAAVPGLRIRRASESIMDVMNANLKHGIAAGNKTVPLESLKGGVRLTDQNELDRVKSLTESIKGEGGYWSRPIVDDIGNVIEGQHRIEAARQLGAKNIPVSIIRDLERDVNVDAMRRAITSVRPLHPDQVHGIVQRALEIAAEAGGAKKAIGQYEVPGFQREFDAALNAMLR